MSRRVYVSVFGGVVNEVIVPPQTDGTWTVIDWDNIGADPQKRRLRKWARSLRKGPTTSIGDWGGRG